MAKKKRYVVRKGKKPGIYTSRNECKTAIHGYAGAQYKSYESRQEAEDAYRQSYGSQITRHTKPTKPSIDWSHIEKDSIAVDAACSSNPGILERQGVETISGKNLFSSTQYPLGTVNIGEWLALIEGMRYIIENERKERVIYSDSRIALGWVRKGIIRTTLPRISRTEILWSHIDRQLLWLQNYGLDLLRAQEITLLKRETQSWGEIPADFGRK